MSKTGISVIEDKSNSSKEIAFTGTVPTDDDIVAGTEGLNYHLVLVRLEALNRELNDNRERERERVSTCDLSK